MSALDTQRTAYIELLKRCLTASLYEESAWQLIEGPLMGNLKRWSLGHVIGWLKHRMIKVLRRRGVLLLRWYPYNAEARLDGLDWPLFGYTMIGTTRLNNIERCVEEVIAKRVPGDLMETGVWRGGSCIFMRALLKAHDVSDRKIWCADSFEGMPVPKSTDRQISSNSDFSDREYLTVSLDQVKANFARFGLLDDQVCFLKGWFCDTLPGAPIARLALLRLDGDLYESTMDALTHLYDRVSPGGFVIVDDYNSWAGCKRAVDEYRQKRQIAAPLNRIDKHAVYWVA